MASGRHFVHRFILAWKGSRGFNAAGTGTGRDGTVLWILLPLISRVTGKERKGTLFKCLIVLALEH